MVSMVARQLESASRIKLAIPWHTQFVNCKTKSLLNRLVILNKHRIPQPRPQRGSQDWFSSNGNSKQTTRGALQTTNTSKTFELAFPSRSYEIFRLSHILGPAAHRRCLCSKATICPTGLYLRDRLSSRLICLAWLITCFAWPLL